MVQLLLFKVRSWRLLPDVSKRIIYTYFLFSKMADMKVNEGQMQTFLKLKTLPHTYILI